MRMSTFETDKEKEIEGAWVDAGAGLRIRVARVGNQEYQRYLQKLGRPYIQSARSGTVPIDVVDDITRRAVARHILLGWENMQDDNDEEIKYSEEKAFELLTEYRDFFELVLGFASDIELFRKENHQAAVGN